MYIIAFAHHLLYRIYHLDGALHIEMRKRTAEGMLILEAEMKCTI